MAEVKFLFDTQLINELENLIKHAKHKLVLISPFIDLDKRIQDALREKLEFHNLEIQVLFGKNEENIYKSIKKDSIDFLKQFPNIEIRYNDRLHAKFYLNDYDFIITSLNLYDYSLAKNIEVGSICNYASKGLIGKVLDGTDTIINHGVDKVRQDVMGLGKELNPIGAFDRIFQNSELKYKTEPIVIEKDGISGMMGGKKLNGFTVKIDNLVNPVKGIINSENNYVTNKREVNTYNSLKKPNGDYKTYSASQLSKAYGRTQTEIVNLMQIAGLIIGDKITDKGHSKGLLVKNYMGKDYIAYPENLDELKELIK